ncbi:MAG TPA: hypothetical protein VN496_01380 [Burkholderiales bacterium]|nr:hypothetical protein [Burkholderiales bacterium]
MPYQIKKWVAIVFGTTTVLVIAVVLAKIASTEPEPMPVEEFGRHVRALGSIAGEIVLFSTQLEQGRLTDNYAKVHCEKLQEELRSRARQLDGPVPPEMAEAGTRVRNSAEALSAMWQELSRHRTDNPEILKIKQQAMRLEQQLGNLETAL